MWSIGCIFAQILKRAMILYGNNSQHQLELIFDLIGTPKTDYYKKLESEKWQDWVRKAKKREGKNFKEFFPNAKP